MKRIFTFLILLILCSLLNAQSNQGIEKILDERGAIKPNSSGSYITTGYTMSYDKYNKPIFNKINSPKNTETVTWGSLGKGRNGTNGTVYAMAVDDSGNIYIGGSFTLVSDIPANFLAKWNTTTGIWSTLTMGSFNGVNNYVKAIAISGNDVYVGGEFTQIGDGTPANYIAKWNNITNIWSTLNIDGSNGVNGSVSAITISGNDVYVGGNFTLLGDGITIANYIAKFNSHTSTWSTLTSGSSNGVNKGVGAIAISGNDVYVGGAFTLLGDNTTSAKHIAKWNSSTSTWSTLTCGNSNGVYGLNDDITAIAISGSDVYVGGYFTQLGDGTTSAKCVAKWNSSTSTWSTLICGVSNGVNSNVHSIAISGSDVYVGGYFNQFGDGTSANSIVKWNTTTGIFSTLTSVVSNGVIGGVNSIAIGGNDVYLGGQFNQLLDWSTSFNYIAKWNGTWSAVGTGNNGVNNYVNAIAVCGNDIYVGGDFTLLNDGITNANHIAKFNTTTNIWSTLISGTSNGVNGKVYAIAINGNDVYVGGQFTQLGDGTSAKNIVKWNTITSTWSTLTSGNSNGVNSFVLALATNGNDVYVGGHFYQLGDGTTSSKCIAKWNCSTSTWSTLNSNGSNGLNGDVRAMAISGSDVYVGGAFTQLGDGTSANYIAKWNSSKSNWSTLTSGASNGVSDWVTALGICDSVVYVGGDFNQLGDGLTNVNHIAKFNSNTNTWSKLTSGNSNGVYGFYSSVTSITISGSDVYVGGQFTKLGDGKTSVNNLAKWNSNSGAWSAIGNGANYSVSAMQINLSDGKMYIGGGFTILNGTTMAYYVGTFTYDPTFIKSGLGIPSKFTLQQNYPNPFNPSTTINYSLPKSGNVKLTVFNSIGSKVTTIVNEYKPAGNYSVQFNGSNLASGIYLYRLESETYSTARKLILIK